MKSKLSLFILISFLMWGISCEDNPISETTGEIELKFVATYDGQPLVMYQSYDYEDGMSFFVERFNFFLSDIAVTKQTNNESDLVEIDEIEYVDFTSIQDEATANEGVVFATATLPTGDYNSIRFGVGVNETLNATQPEDYAVNHPLQNDYWSWAKGYIFTKIEGKADTNGDGMKTELLTYHIGSNDLFSDKILSKNFTISTDEKTSVTFEVDLKKVLVDTPDFLDFRTTPIDHTNDMEVSDFILTNLNKAISIK